MLSGPDQLSDFQVYSVYGGAYERFSKIVFDGIDDCPFSLLQLKTRKYCPLDVRQPGARRAAELSAGAGAEASPSVSPRRRC